MRVMLSSFFGQKYAGEINSIQQFCQDGAQKLTGVFSNYASDLTPIAEMVYVQQSVHLMLSHFTETIQSAQR